MIILLFSMLLKNFLSKKVINGFKRMLFPLTVMKCMMFMSCFKQDKRIIVLSMEQEITEEQLGLLSQLENFHVFHDLVAAWMEKVSSGVPNITTFGMPLNCNSKFELSIIFLLYLSCFFCVLSISCIQEVLIVSQMLSWLHWKFDVT
jgi:hypothetical protein